MPTEFIDDEQLTSALSQIAQATDRGDISVAAMRNIEDWLRRPYFREDTQAILQHINDQDWATLERAFWQVLPFGTAGRRGPMHPIGSNAINHRTMGESVQATADYLRSLYNDAQVRTAVGYDCRHKSREFAELAAGIFVAAGFEVYFLGEVRTTPLLGLTVREHACHCGVMITASHNPPSDNAIKVFWSHGGQILSPHDQEITARIAKLTAINQLPWEEAVETKRVVDCLAPMDEAYRDASLSLLPAGARELSIVYSPLHGGGSTSVFPFLQAAGFSNVETYAPHATMDPDFPNVPDHVANPEDARVFHAIQQHAQAAGADLIIASDPDADRIGCSAPVTFGSATWATLTGNQIGALLADYLLTEHQKKGSLTAEHYLLTTVVSSQMIEAIAAEYGVRSFGGLLTGFKWIGQQIEEWGPEHFLFGFEEAHGYLVGSQMRDKDAAGAALLIAARAAAAKVAGKTLHDELDDLYRRVGCFQELSVSKRMPGAEGMQRMREVMDGLRDDPPQRLGGLQVHCLRDYLTGLDRFHDGTSRACEVPQSNLLVFSLEKAGYRAAIRPSGTEPKIKFYLFASSEVAEADDLDSVKQSLQDHLHQVHDTLMQATGLAVELA